MQACPMFPAGGWVLPVEAALPMTAVPCGVALILVIAQALSGARGAEAMVWPVAGPWDMIAFEVKSWGRPVTSWRLLHDGAGSWTENVVETGGPAPRYSVAWREIAVGEPGFDRIVLELSRLPVPAPDAATCLDFMTDLPYGKVRLTRGATTVEIAWNSGCMDSDYKAFSERLKAVDSIVAGWGRAGRLLRIEPLSASR